MTRTTAIRALVVGAPLPFAALLTQHPTGGDDLYELVSDNLGQWMLIHYAGAFFFPLMAVVIWLLIRDLPGRAATLARCALPVYALVYTVWETIFGLAVGLMAQSGQDLSAAEQRGLATAIEDIVASPIVGEPGLFVAVSGLAWWTAVAAAIMALKHAGVRPAALVLLGVGGLMTMHVPPIGPPALVCLSVAAFLIERHRAATTSARNGAGVLVFQP